MVVDADDRLQEVTENGLDGLGKPIGDPRITSFGRYLRRYGIDEIPQVYNLVNGEMSLVGLRPRGDVDWEHFSDEHKERALQYKPGLMGIPYAHIDLESFEDLVGAELTYLDRREERPLQTQVRYFFAILYNFFFKGVRSR
jgi:lipopolysaccharide/colanic/teichoic acid biosynthesis glycosyltransferase